jgi:flagellar basal-body rod protein FlgG
MQSLSIASTGMLAQQLNVEVISNNIANMSTSGFKRQRAEFQDLIYQDLRRVGSSSSDAGTVVPTGIQIGMGVQTGSVYRVMSQGNFDNTENPLDLAIQGNGFFHIQMPNGDDAYTRYVLQPGITVPEGATSISINATGDVEVTLDGQTTPTTVGTIDLTIFQNDAGLNPIGDNLYMETVASGSGTTGNPGGTGYGSLLQGYLETSNVDSVAEITSLITAQRAYEMNSKVITTSDEMMSVTSNLR